MALKNIIGQERGLRILLGTLRRGRVPSAMLISGDGGIGKKLAALNYAKAVNCLQPVGGDCCDVCISCRKIDAGIHPDVALLLPEGEEIKIEVIRKLEETLFLKPYEGRKKVAIIDDADLMNINAANAFLKTLEEPPAESLIVLVASNPDSLPDTITSRCTRVRFYPLPPEAVERVLSGAAPGERGLAVSLSMGRPGLALSGDLQGEREWFARLLEAMLQGEPKELWADKSEMKSWLDMAAVFLRDLAIARISGDESGSLHGASPYRPPRQVAAERVVEVYQQLRRLRDLLDFNLNKSISWNYAARILQTLHLSVQSRGAAR